MKFGTVVYTKSCFPNFILLYCDPIVHDT